MTTMRFQSAELKSVLSVLGKAAGKTSLSILENVHLTARDGFVVLTMRDNDTQISAPLYSHSAPSEMDGKSFLVPFHLFNAIAEQDGDTTIVFQTERGIFSAEFCGQSVTGGLGGNAKDYPLMKLEGETITRTYHWGVLLGAIKAVDWAKDTKNANPVINALCIADTESGTDIVATNGNVLACAATNARIQGDEGTTMLPPSLVKVLLSGISGERVTTETNDTNVKLSFDRYTIIGPLVLGNYPKYKSVMPKGEHVAVIRANRVQLLQSLNRQLLYMGGLMKLEAKGGIITTMSADLDFGTDSRTRIAATQSGEDTYVGLQPSLFARSLGQLGGQLLEIRLYGSSKAFTMQGADERVTLLMMPMAITDDAKFERPTTPTSEAAEPTEEAEVVEEAEEEIEEATEETAEELSEE